MAVSGGKSFLIGAFITSIGKWTRRPGFLVITGTFAAPAGGLSVLVELVDDSSELVSVATEDSSFVVSPPSLDFAFPLLFAVPRYTWFGRQYRCFIGPLREIDNWSRQM
jgi:hypothetical protein